VPVETVTQPVIKEGSRVGKRAKTGFKGEVRKVEGDTALIRWDGEYERTKSGQVVRKNGKPVEKLTRVPLTELVLFV
jgi:hypothetical protein